MKAALIGDIHANLPALEAVLAHIQEQGIEKIWNVGDFVGYGPFPDEVVRLFRTAQRLQNEDMLNIVGNYDLKVLKFKQKKKNGARKSTLRNICLSSGPMRTSPKRAANTCAFYPRKYGSRSKATASC